MRAAGNGRNNDRMSVLLNVGGFLGGFCGVFGFFGGREFN